MIRQIRPRYSQTFAGQTDKCSLPWQHDWLVRMFSRFLQNWRVWASTGGERPVDRQNQWRGEITSPDAGGAARACFSPLCLHPGVCWRCSLVLTAHPLTDWLWPGLGLGARSRARPGPGLSSADHSPALVTSRHSPELGFQSVVPSLLSLKPVISSALPLVSWHRTALFHHCIERLRSPY